MTRSNTEYDTQTETHVVGVGIIQQNLSTLCTYIKLVIKYRGFCNLVKGGIVFCLETTLLMPPQVKSWQQ
mgnify:CR=1 FL=1